MFVPELNSPIARARSFFGNHSATVLIDAGNVPASPNPRPKREIAKWVAFRAKLCDIEHKLHNATEQA